MIEKDKVGGTCLHRGCIPAKELLESASVHRTVAPCRASSAWSSDEPTIDWYVTVDRKQRVVDQMFGGLSQLLKTRKVDVYAGPRHARAVPSGARGRHTDGTEAMLLGTHIVLATRLGAADDSGLRARRPPACSPATSSSTCASSPTRRWSSAAGRSAASSPRRWPTWALRSPILEGLPKILPGCDTDVANVVERSFKKKGMTIRTGVAVTGHTPRRRRRDRRCASATARRSTSTSWWCPSAAARSPRESVAEGTGRRGRRSRASSRSTRTAGPANRGVGGRRLHRHPAARPRRRSSRASTSSRTSWARTRRRSTTARSRGRSTATPRSASPGIRSSRPRRRASTSSPRSTGSSATVERVILGETDGLVKVIAEKRPDGSAGHHPRRPHGRPVGHRAARSGIPRGQLGRHRRRGGRAHPAPPLDERAVRRDRAVPHRPLAALTAISMAVNTGRGCTGSQHDRVTTSRREGTLSHG